MKPLWLKSCIVVAIALVSLAYAKSDEPKKAVTPVTDPMRGNAPGDVRDENNLKMKLVWCPPGFLTMEHIETVEEPATSENDGENSAKTRSVGKFMPVKVLLTQGYWLGQYEVTQSEWKQVMATVPWTGRIKTKANVDLPATCVSWGDAMAFCRKLTEQERESGRLPDNWEYTLPTDAQWERACRARTETQYSFGDDESKLGDYAWFRDNAQNDGEDFAHQVGQKKANAWGLFDMHGNVWEFCRDRYAVTLPGGRDPEVKTKEITDRSDRVVRGGSWFDCAWRCRAANRQECRPHLRSIELGFRVALIPVR